MTLTPGPWRVVPVDVDAPLPALGGARPDGDAYEGALVFLLRDGALVGELEVPLTGPVDLAELVAPLAQRAPAKQPAVPESRLPFISIVVPTTMARGAELDRCLDALLALDYPGYEVILVDNRPSRSPQRARLHAELLRDPRVHIVAEPRRGISAARNRGVRAAQGEIIAFTDDDAFPDRRWLRAVGARFAAEPATGCVTGPVLPAELETAAQLWFERSGSKLPNRAVATTIRGPRRPGGVRRRAFEVEISAAGEPPRREFVYRAGSFGMGANLSMRRSTLDSLRGFAEALGTGTACGGGEDIEALVRLLRSGGQVTFDPAAIVWHRHRPDLADARRQMHGYGRGLTAALAALVVRDPRHLAGFLHLAADAVRVFGRRSAHRRSVGYPRQLAARERSGLVVGPLAYLWEGLRPRRRREPVAP